MRQDFAVGQAGDFLPELERFVVVDIDGDQQLSAGTPNSLVTRFQASSMARSLK